MADPRSLGIDVGHDQGVIVHGTRVFRDRAPGRAAAPDEVSTTALGAWYATVLRWRRPVALLVNEPTLLPLLMQLAPARTLLARIPGAIADLLAAHRLPAAFIGLDHLPSRSFAINTAGLTVVMLAVDLIAATQHLLLHGHLAKAEPKTLR